MIRILLLAAALAVSVPATAGDPVAGREKSKPCAVCHGENGVSAAPDFPKLAGQHRDYLERTLKDYKSGARKSAIMAGQVGNLKPADIADLAAFYSSQQALTTKY